VQPFASNCFRVPSLTASRPLTCHRRGTELRRAAHCKRNQLYNRSASTWWRRPQEG
jgi:hypothetical protein